MMSFKLSGGVEVFGFISPSDPTDDYPVIDPLYGIDGFRNVSDLNEMNSIPFLRRRAGMVVGINGGSTYYKLNPEPWNYTITDWSLFQTGGGGGGSFTGGTVTGDTIFTGGLTATTFSASTYLGLPLDIRVTGGTYDNNTGTATFTNNTGGTFNVIGFYTGQTSYVNSLTTGVGLSANTTTGDITIINTDPDQLVTISGGTGILTGGTYPNFTIENTLPDQTVVINNGSNISVNGTYPNFTIDVTGLTDNNTFITGFTYNNNTFTISDNSGSTFNATINAVTGLTVNGILSATTYQNLPTDIRVTGATYNNNNTFIFTNNTGGTFTTTFNIVSGLTVNGNLTVTGNTNVRAVTGTTALFSGSGQNILTIVGSGNTLSQPLFSVLGSSGELFSISDSLVGSLFSVNDISGLPVIEVFSDNTILMGDYQSPSLNTTKRLILSAGTNTVYAIPTSAYTGVFVDYTLTSTIGARSGNIMSIWSGVTSQYSETSTNDIGTTSGVTFSVSVLGGNAVISSSATTSNWTLKTIIRSI
jgi:hypothetical protein